MKSLAIAALALGFGLSPAPAQTPPAANPPAAAEGPGADAPRERPRKEAFEHRMQDRMERALKLTEEQKAKVKDIRARHAGAIQAKADAARAARKAFGEALRNPDAKPEDLRTLHRAMADAELEALLEHRAQRQEIRAVLTPEQREKAAWIMGRAEGMHKGPGGRW